MSAVVSKGELFRMVIGIWIVSLLIMYFVISAAVKNGIDQSEVGQLIKKKYAVKEDIAIISDQEIEKELEQETNK